MQSKIVSLLNHLVDSGTLSQEVQDNLSTDLLADRLRAKAFGITPENVHQRVRQRSQLFTQVYSEIDQLWHQQLQISTPFAELLWNLWLPLALRLIAAHQALDRPFVQGFLGAQGTGKTTLTTVLHSLLQLLGYPTLSLSLDDFYKTYTQRQRLQQEDPRLIWRGPPGTHDIDLGLQVLTQLRYPTAGAIAIPRFDKSAFEGSGDQGEPEIVQPVKLILFEGWFVGLRPIDPHHFKTAPPPIFTAADRQFARDMNARLQDYLPLWQQLDSLIVLYPEQYRLSQQWRRQAEHQLKACGKSGMSDSTLDQFVEYFWCALHPELFIRPLIHDPRVDLVIEIQADHLPNKIYCPGDIANQ